MQKRRLIFVAVALLCLGAFAAAQDVPRVLARADEVVEQPGRTTFTGNARISVNGVMVQADRAVIQNGEVAFEGNVRVTLPRGGRVSIVKDGGPSPLKAVPIPLPPGNQP